MSCGLGAPNIEGLAVSCCADVLEEASLLCDDIGAAPNIAGFEGDGLAAVFCSSAEGTVGVFKGAIGVCSAGGCSDFGAPNIDGFTEAGCCCVRMS